MIISRLLSSFMLVSLAACSLGKSPPENFYTLSAEPFVGGAATSDALRGKRIAVALVHIDELVDRPQWVVRTTPNRVTVLEQQRWAEELKTQIPRVVAENLQKLLPQTQTAASTRGEPPLNYQVLLDVQKFEASNTEVNILIAWSLQNGQGKLIKQASVPTREAVKADLEASGYAAIARAQSVALGRVSADIAASLKQAPNP